MWGVLLANAKNDRRLHALDWLVYSVVIGISQWLYFNRQRFIFLVLKGSFGALELDPENLRASTTNIFTRKYQELCNLIYLRGFFASLHIAWH
jgi:hypothetical protein